uniref:Uncharacterized protein n=1 Tax=Rhizophora mucronata TaxID=61149 RepID=A0A2P2NQ07_RHIMU
MDLPFLMFNPVQ